MDKLNACDLVDEPAANRDGLFAAAFAKTPSFEAELAFSQLDLGLEEMGVTAEALPRLLDMYFVDPDSVSGTLRALARVAESSFGYGRAEMESFISRYVLARQIRPFFSSHKRRESNGNMKDVVVETAVAS